MAVQREATRSRRNVPRQPGMGIYAIRNVVNQRVYVAGACDLARAMSRDRSDLELKEHRCERLQADWLAHGEGAFRFEVLDTIGVRNATALDLDFRTELDSLLELWRAELKCYERGYNTRVPCPWLTVN